jgi:hypothetical protein
MDTLEIPASMSSNGRYFQFKQIPGVIKRQFNSAEGYGGKLPLAVFKCYPDLIAIPNLAAHSDAGKHPGNYGGGGRG